MTKDIVTEYGLLAFFLAWGVVALVSEIRRWRQKDDNKQQTCRCDDCRPL